MEEDIQNYLPTVMFRGTPCIFLIIVFIVYINTKNDFLFQSCFLPILQTCKQREVVSFSFFTCNMLIGVKALLIKSRLHCIDKIADHCIKRVTFSRTTVMMRLLGADEYLTRTKQIFLSRLRFIPNFSSRRRIQSQRMFSQI